MLYRTSTLAAVVTATVAAAVGSAYITPPWDMLLTVLARIGGVTSILFMAVRFQENRR